MNHSNCGAVAVHPCEVLDTARLLTGRVLEITGPSAASRMKALEVSYFWTLQGLEGLWACDAVYGCELAQVLLGQPPCPGQVARGVVEAAEGQRMVAGSA